MGRGLCGVLHLLVLVFVLCGIARADSYWIENGGQRSAFCEGKTDGTMLKLGNPGDRTFLVTGILMCTDRGDHYELRFDFVSVRVNPTRIANIQRDRVDFDWLGLAIYRPKPNRPDEIEWQFDEATMIAGTLERDGGKAIYFGNLGFDVPKAGTEGATRFTFYMTWKGHLETFEVL
ncbi:hypothetical protein HFO77_29165 [Rhizobium leguminosarum]|nr:hypothetical protein [Rhizobium leguminosarum]